MGNQYEERSSEALIAYCSGEKPKKYADHVDTIILVPSTAAYGEAPTKAIGEGGQEPSKTSQKERKQYHYLCRRC